MSVITTAVSGLRAASTHIRTKAHNIANALTPGFQSARVNQTSTNPGVKVDVTYPPDAQDGSNNVALEKELTDMMVQEKAYKANLKTLQTFDDMQGELLNIKS